LSELYNSKYGGINMGWTFEKMYEDNPAQDGEKWNT